jgi:hypothetical protein
MKSLSLAGPSESDAGALDSVSPETSLGLKSRQSETHFCPCVDTSLLVTSGGETCQKVVILRRPPETRPRLASRGRQREASTARQRSAASSPERTAGANRGPHVADQPAAGACPRPGRATARGTTTGRTAPTTAVRRGAEAVGGLYLTSVRTSQEPLIPASTGGTALSGWSV